MQFIFSGLRAVAEVREVGYHPAGMPKPRFMGGQW